VWQKRGVKSNLARRRSWGGSVRGDASGSVTRSPESQLFELRTGLGGPTPPLASPRTDPPHDRLTLYRLSSGA